MTPDDPATARDLPRLMPREPRRTTAAAALRMPAPPSLSESSLSLAEYASSSRGRAGSTDRCSFLGLALTRRPLPEALLARLLPADDEVRVRPRRSCVRDDDAPAEINVVVVVVVSAAAAAAGTSARGSARAGTEALAGPALSLTAS
jgi:hypothetical protein